MAASAVVPAARTEEMAVQTVPRALWQTGALAMLQVLIPKEVAWPAAAPTICGEKHIEQYPLVLLKQMS